MIASFHTQFSRSHFDGRLCPEASQLDLQSYRVALHVLTRVRLFRALVRGQSDTKTSCMLTFISNEDSTPRCITRQESVYTPSYSTRDGESVRDGVS